MTKSTIEKHSVVIAGHKTSISLEKEFWQGVKEAAAAAGKTLSDFVNAIDQKRKPGTNLSSALRLAVLAFYAGTEDKAA